jgi:hypothetical protein
LKIALAYILIFVVSFIYNYETIVFFSDAIGKIQVSAIDDVDSGKNNPESEEKEKEQKISYLDDLYMSNHIASVTPESCCITDKHNASFSSSDYSQVVYSPPELS